NSQGATGGIVAEINALGLPFLFNDTATAYALLQGEIGDNLKRRMADKGLIALDWWEKGIRQRSNSKKPIEKPSDLAGMQSRTPADAMAVDLFPALGGAAEQIAFSQLNIALPQAVADGQENPLANFSSSKLYELNP